MPERKPKVGKQKREGGRIWVWDGTVWVDAGPVPPAKSGGGGAVPMEVLPDLDDADG